MKAILSVLFALMALPAFAWEWEASLGKTQYTRHAKETGNWAQPGPASQGFRDQVDMTSIGYTLGAAGRLAPSWKWRAGYANLGKTTSTATATNYDEEFDFNTNQCIANCDKLATYVGSADVSGVYATVGRVFSVAGFEVTPEAGIWLYENQLSMWKYAPSSTHTILYEVPTGNRRTIGPVFGVSVGKKNVSIALTAYSVRSGSKEVPSINDGKSYALKTAVRVEF